MDNYIALLLLVMPGYLAKIINGHLCDNINTSNKFKLVMESLLYDAVIIPIVYTVIRIRHPEVENVGMFFSDIGNSICYGLCAAFVAVLVGGAWKCLLPKYQEAINFLRGKDENAISIGKSVFDLTFNDGSVHLVEVYRDGNLIGRGYLSDMYYDNKEMTLVDAQEVFALLGEGTSKKYKAIYMDWGNSLLVKEIDMEANEKAHSENAP